MQKEQALYEVHHMHMCKIFMQLLNISNTPCHLKNKNLVGTRGEVVIAVNIEQDKCCLWRERSDHRGV